MFDIGATELLLLVVVAVLVIGPKDLPLALRTAGKWMGKIRRISTQFRTGVDSMIREAEMEEMEQKWKDKNEEIMKATPEGEMGPLPDAENSAPSDAPSDVSAEAALPKPEVKEVPAEPTPAPAPPTDVAPAADSAEPPLPFGNPPKKGS
ncbi:Sec-independent protein translocase protein TatB [Altererythrobacter sp. ZODW24]|uniref:Sec-independent protein translocase protein TatB n=1 Tax=Altererythrobacter sp. ZODW24 TaxID=2185142 RepID=UPI000DF79928|nr:Sec-independent protein translocase protein TatB [Altererythrobacter sp. ZODW24]